MKNWISAGVLAILAIATQAQTTCVDPLACNFTELGECEFLDDNGMPCVTEGCAIPGACNFNPEADINDGSCDFTSCLGCTDEAACNYDPEAVYFDLSCIYFVDCNGVCGGDWIEDECGNCYPLVVSIEESQIYSFTGEREYLIIPDGVLRVGLILNGASGGNSLRENGGNSIFVGGKGASVHGVFDVSPGDSLEIIVGERGTDGNCGASGGGGSFVKNVTEGVLLAAAGGGGGAFHCNAFGGRDGGDGRASSSGGDGLPVGPWSPLAGGSNGHGGNSVYGGGGGGYLSSGNGQTNSQAGQAYPGGASASGNGGFGGGGGHYGYCCGGAGGGGGYSGGSGCDVTGAAGGGGSFLHQNGEETLMSGGQNLGHGSIEISFEMIDIPQCDLGCTNNSACNFDPDATTDDGSCDFCFCGPGTEYDLELGQCMIVNGSSDINGDGCTNLNDLLDLLSGYGTCED